MAIAAAISSARSRRAGEAVPGDDVVEEGVAAGEAVTLGVASRVAAGEEVVGPEEVAEAVRSSGGAEELSAAAAAAVVSFGGVPVVVPSPEPTAVKIILGPIGSFVF